MENKTRTAEDNKKINVALEVAKDKCGLELSDFDEIDFENETTREVLQKILSRVAEIEFIELEDFLKTIYNPHTVTLYKNHLTVEARYGVRFMLSLNFEGFWFGAGYPTKSIKEIYLQCL